jgi:ABC-type multidrug transport system fused ATPase/permease subunit
LSILAIFYVSLELHLIGQVTPASIAVWTMLPLAIYEILITIPGSLNNWSQGRAAAQRIDEIASSNESRNEFLQDFTVSFKPGESIAIRGPSGSGKSTLLLTLLGLIDEKGELKIGDKILNSNVDIENDTEIVASMQDSYMFDSSIRENLTLSGENISESQIWDALKQVGLMELVAGLPNGLDELVGVNGSNFSGGEKQRLSLARVFLSQARIIILDEPTEHLDNELSKIVFANIMKLCPDRTVIYASHKNVEINAATHLIQMNKGIATLLS